MSEVVAGELVLTGGAALSTDVPDQIQPHIAGWLLAVAHSTQTLRAYQGDVREWFGWCAAHHVDPLEVTRSHVDVWARWMAGHPSARTGRPLAASSRARRLSTVASLYAWLVDAGVVAAVPVRRSARPKVPAVSTTVGMDQAEARAFLARLAVESVTDRALLLVLLLDGLRVSEATGCTVGSVGWSAGQVTLAVLGKGGRPRTLVLPAPTVAAVEEMLTARAAAAGLGGAADLPEGEPLFARAGGGRVTQQAVFRTVQRVARAAGVRSWAVLSPHSLRHSCATLLLDQGVPLHVVRDQLGHAAAATTERYDRARNALGRTGAAVHGLAAALVPDADQRRL